MQVAWGGTVAPLGALQRVVRWAVQGAAVRGAVVRLEGEGGAGGAAGTAAGTGGYQGGLQQAGWLCSSVNLCTNT